MKIILTAIALMALLFTPLFAHELGETLPQIQKSGKIRIGYRESSPPMSSLNKDGIPEGYSIDLCLEIVAGIENKIGKDIEIEYVSVTSTERFKALSDNKIDILCGVTTKTIKRGEIVDFTQLTFITGGAFMTLKGSGLKNNFDGKKVGVSKNSTTYTALKELFQDPNINAEIVVVESRKEGLKSLEEGKIDALSADQVVLIGMALKSGNPEKFAILPNLFSYEPFALAVRRNDADFRLEADRVLSNLYRSKKILPIYKKWFEAFSSEIPTAFATMVVINGIPE